VFPNCEIEEDDTILIFNLDDDVTDNRIAFDNTMGFEGTLVA
jgi:hypothetical protein